ncbi:protein cornichon homolog 4-like [Anneissia japonica]|uniref:protein cornichon homolog 4-like n=1 Tax=Anneissia japonica TaxID=1529436 RepID=UPI001425A343|nr:protein cornichon homolog 4-like [Anneissia japonica]
MVSSEVFTYLLTLIDSTLLLFLAVYFIITLSDLESDYLNAQSCCSKLNTWVIPEMLASLCATLLLLFNLHWFLFLYTLPLSGFLVYRYLNIPAGNFGMFDPTEIHNRGYLKSYMKETMVKMGFHLISFFIYLYCMISVLVNG